MIWEYQDNVSRALQVVSPLLECFEVCQEFLVIDFIVELSRDHPMGVESDQVQVTIFGRDLGDDGCNGIV